MVPADPRAVKATLWLDRVTSNYADAVLTVALGNGAGSIHSLLRDPGSRCC